MPLIIEGYIAVSVRDLKAHEAHELRTWAEPDGHQVLWCVLDGTMVEEERRSTSLPCGCPDRAGHDEGVRLQNEVRRDYRIPKSTCVGCYMGDDGPSVHSCVIHEQRYWPA